MTGKLAVLIYGPEGTGNKLAHRIFIACGAYGDGENKQRIDLTGIPDNQDVIVWGRSVPSDNYWPDISSEISQVKGQGFSPFVIVLVRDPFALINSQINRKLALNLEHSVHLQQRAYRHIFKHLIAVDEVPYLVVPYEVLENASFVEWLLSSLGLEVQETIEPIENRNAQYYG